MMFKKGDVVIRTVESFDAAMSSGTRAVVQKIIDDRYMELEGYTGEFRMSKFILVTPEEANKTSKILSDVEALTDALKTIDVWNRAHPTGLMVSVEAYPVQDGGSLFCVNGEGFNNIEEFHKYISVYSDKRDKRKALQYAMNMIKAELNEE